MVLDTEENETLYKQLMRVRAVVSPVGELLVKFIDKRQVQDQAILEGVSLQAYLSVRWR